MKTKEERTALREEYENRSKKLTELNEEELKQVAGGVGACDEETKKEFFSMVYNDTQDLNDWFFGAGIHGRFGDLAERTAEYRRWMITGMTRANDLDMYLTNFRATEAIWLEYDCRDKDIELCFEMINLKIRCVLHC